MYKLPRKLPLVYIGQPNVTPTPASSPSTQYDVAFQGLGFRYANTPQDPIVRSLAPLERTRVDQAQEAGEQTLLNWWMRSQSSFHGGAGLVNLEPQFPNVADRIRYLTSKNLDVWTPGHVKVLPGVRIVQSTATIRNILFQAGTPNSPGSSSNPTIFYHTSSTTVTKVNIVGAGSDVVTTYTIPNSESAVSIATDGASVFVASTARVYRMTYTGTFTELYTTPASTTSVVLSWVKDRLMCSCNNSVYELNSAKTGATSVIGATSELRYTHPNASFAWGIMTESPKAVIAPGWDGTCSVIYQFPLDTSGSTPALKAGGVIAKLPAGEKINGLVNAQGSFLGIATSRGIRVGTFEAYYGYLSYGPLSVTGYFTGITTQDRFLYAHTSAAPDEPGLVRVDLGTTTDQAGRYAWSPDQISPTDRTGVNDPYGEVLFDPVAGNAYWSNGAGLHQASTATTQSRTGYLQTAAVRFATTEPKLFKLGRVRGDFSTGQVRVTGQDSLGNSQALLTYRNAGDSGEFALNPGQLEYLQLTFTLSYGADFTRYQMKALPGTPRQEAIQVVVACEDRELTRAGNSTIRTGTARARYEALRDLSKLGDQITFQEFLPTGTVSTTVVIDQVQYKQDARATKTDPFGGIITVALRTVA